MGAVLGEEESEVEVRQKAQFRAETLVERKPANEPEPESRSGEGTGEKKIEMFEIQGRNNVERKTASEAKPLEDENLRNPKIAEIVEIKEESEEIKTAEIES